jgi:hypothetical protein
LRTHRLQVEQWCARSGLRAWHFLQKRISPLDLTVKVVGLVVARGSLVGRVLYPLSLVVLPGAVNTAFE